MKIVLGSASLAQYLQGGGHWSVYLQYLFALRELGHSVFLLELLPMTGRPGVDRRRIGVFLGRMRRLGFAQNSAVLPYEGQNPPKYGDAFGIEATALRQIVRTADVLWNFHFSVRPPFLNEFKRSVAIDLDPGWMQVSALYHDFGLHEHSLFLTTGTKLSDPDTLVPSLGHEWHSFLPPIYMPMWQTVRPPRLAPLSSVTQWGWANDLKFRGAVFSSSKRDAYLRFLDLPKRCAVPILLAANIHPKDETGDRELSAHGWKLVQPHRCIRTVTQYQRFIQNSLAEFGCAKSVYTRLRTGWFSDRSAAYLASGRPVIAEDTGFSDHLPTGMGLLSFTTLDEAVAAIDNLRTSYPQHEKAARELAQAYFDSKRVLERMIELL